MYLCKSVVLQKNKLVRRNNKKDSLPLFTLTWKKKELIEHICICPDMPNTDIEIDIVT